MRWWWWLIAVESCAVRHYAAAVRFASGNATDVAAYDYAASGAARAVSLTDHAAAAAAGFDDYRCLDRSADQPNVHLSRRQPAADFRERDQYLPRNGSVATGDTK